MAGDLPTGRETEQEGSDLDDAPPPAAPDDEARSRDLPSWLQRLTDRLERVPGGALVARFLPQGAVVLSLLSLGYFVMGQIRNRVFANTFGAGPELDAYYAAFRLPEIALDVLVAAGLTAPFVPIFTKLRLAGDEGAANAFGRTVLTVAVLVMSVAVLVLFLVAPDTVGLVAPGFDAATRDLYVELFRLMCVTAVVFAASTALGEVLVANQRFVFYALAPILYTGGIVVGTLVLGERLGIRGTALGAVGGAFAHLAIRGLGLLQTTFRPRPLLAVRTPAFTEFVKLMLPRMVSYPIDPLVVTYFTRVASGLGAGSVAAYNFASDYQFVPVSLIGVSFSVAVFPALSAAFAAGDGHAFRRILGRNVATVAVLTAIAAIVMFVVAELGIRLLLGGGRFGEEDVARTSEVLAVFALSVPFDALSYPLSRGLYATHNTLLQVVASFAGFAVLLAATTLLVPTAGLIAIPLGYAAGSAVKVALLAVFLVARLRRVGRPSVSRSAGPPSAGAR